MGTYQTRNRRRVVVPRGTMTYTGSSGVPVTVPQAEISVAESVTSFRSGIVSDFDLSKIKSEGDLYRSLAANDNAVRISAPYDTGHTFDSSQYKFIVPKNQLDFSLDSSKTSGVMWKGYFIPRVDGTHGIGSDGDGMPQKIHEYISENQLNILGSKAISLTVPTRPHASLAQALLELKDGLPTLVLADLVKRKGRAANTIGGEYLNYTFGIVPLVSDIQKLALAVLNFNKILDQYKRDSGHIVRRRHYFENESSSDAVQQYSGDINIYNGVNFRSGYLPYIFQSQAPFADISQSQTYSRKVWFSGAFTYFLEDGSDFSSKMLRYEQLANELLGTRITPSTIWELTPWSWLLDWWLDVGTFINNATTFSQDSLVMRYGYLMCEEVHRTNVIYDNIRLYDGKSVKSTVSQVVNTRKRRLRATPYGFGITLDSLSDGQWAILAALGLTRAPKTLR